MTYLLDVNVLVAWGWSDHSEHGRAAGWIRSTGRRRSVRLLSSAIPELGFVRVSVQRAAGRLSVAEASATLASMLGSLGNRHAFLADDLPSTTPLPAWCDSASRSTDAHLLALAARHGATLATLDTGIPDALLLPPVDR